jgi:acyl-[acyl-carrier-protein]-phospholipid O-acyltransferase/long-chain-fatty-acid--[acyl-carrier-protein] ligase
LGRYFRVFLGDKTLFYTEAGLVYFWSAGSLIAANVLVLGKDEFALESDLYVGIMNACLVVGIGLGHMAAGFVSGETINRRLVPYGMFGVAAGCAAMAYPGHTFISSLPVLFVMGFAAGFYAVPLNATLQDRSPRSAKGGMIAASNFINFSGMLLAGGVYFAIGFLDPSSFLVFGVIAAVTVGAAVFITKKLPVGAEETA